LEFSSAGKKLIAMADKLSPLGANRFVAWLIGLAILGLLVLGSAYNS